MLVSAGGCICLPRANAAHIRAREVGGGGPYDLLRVGADRVLELGCGLGYSALCLARSSHGLVETIEQDPDHVRLAETEIEREGYSERVRVLLGSGSAVLPTLEGPYDLVFSDGDPEEMPLDLKHFLRLLRPGGLLVSANLFLAQFVPDLPGIPQMAEYRTRILEDDRLLTAMIPGGLALASCDGRPGLRNGKRRASFATHVQPRRAGCRVDDKARAGRHHEGKSCKEAVAQMVGGGTSLPLRRFLNGRRGALAPLRAYFRPILGMPSARTGLCDSLKAELFGETLVCAGNGRAWIAP